jgi:hypothetical protein
VGRRWKCLRTMIPLVVLCGIFVYGQDFEMLLDGRIEDFQRLPSQAQQSNEFTFVRLIYNGRIPGYLKNWYTDYPTGDRHLIDVLKRQTVIDVAPETRALPIQHPDLFSYPVVYSAEAGQMVLDDRDAQVLREYLTRGGFWMIDDFWGTFEWSNFEREMKKIFPDRPIVEISPDHPIFHSFYDVSEKMQVPNVGFAYCGGCPTYELDGYEPFVRGIFDANGRLLVFINFNTDLMDASEWADDPRYPSRFAAHSYKVFTNAVIYAMSH